MNVHNVEEINNNGSLLVYNNNASKNVIFIGSCRTVPLMFYYNTVCKDRNIYSILVYKYPKINSELIHQILKNTDIIICENVEHFEILNTNIKSEITFFKHFKVDSTIHIHYIPNLELRMFNYDIINTFKINKQDVYNYFLISRERLVKRIIEFGYSDLWHDITKYLYKVRLFSTFSHPTRILSCLMFKHMSIKLGLKVLPEDYTEFLKHSFIEGNDTPIFQEDIDMYSFSFPCILNSSGNLETPGIIVRAIESENNIEMFI